ncbi:sulfate/thiosulfate-binding protein [Rivularia sp. PCC 7116]|uniref:sulfate ABC transporter substrate-binding protein n=1 Tax=Rivularia sp. PCC 7116 TaxID=373994 RepID=UPI00029EFB8B|nr:sulfate ABC transporter substrate-binding protein [Rivularia sp. PCC 7116]AFY53188.1 sulfate/thiosulfate-binding protein [Rivularia sp. PCC 7116]
MGLWRFVARLMTRGGIKSFVLLFLLGLSISVSLISCSASNAQNSNRVDLTLVSYAVTKPAYRKIIPQFVQEWKQKHNQTVRFYESYGASGAQTRAVVDGLDADVVELALALDMQRIEKAGLIQPGWENEAPSNSMVTQSVAALVTREGNPKQINDWQDLTKDDVSIITANPKTSGVARWNFLALYGSQSETGAEDKALDFTSKVYQNVPILPRDAREASDAFFNQGQGDVLINYENELILAGLKGKPSNYIVPETNILIENPVAVIDKNVEKHGNRKVAEAFVEYLFTPAAQREFAKIGFRPVNPVVKQEFASKYPPVKTLFTVNELGGWDKLQDKFFADGAAFDEIQKKIGNR